LEEVAQFNSATGLNLPVGDANAWPSQLQALEDCASQLQTIAGSLVDEDLAAVMKSKAGLPEKLRAVQEVKTQEDGLRSRGWDPALYDKDIRQALANQPNLVGPLPAGWDPKDMNFERIEVIITEKLENKLPELGWDINRLNARQLKEILTGNIENKLADLGWKENDIYSIDSVQEVLTTKQKGPQTPAGKRFAQLGGKWMIENLQRLGFPTGSASSWESQLQALESCLTFVNENGAKVHNQNVKGLVASAAGLDRKYQAVTEALAREKEEEESLRSRNWNPAELSTEVRKLLLKDRELKGPLPAGWDIKELNENQVFLIARDQLPNRLAELGWKLSEVPGYQLSEIILQEIPHPSSPEMKRYEELGGDALLRTVRDINQLRGAKLPGNGAKTFKEKLAALEALPAAMIAFVRANYSHLNLEAYLNGGDSWDKKLRKFYELSE
jgi:hypothetical protein